MTERRHRDGQEAPLAEAMGQRLREAALTVEAPAQLRERLAAPARAARRERWRLPALAAGGALVAAIVLAVFGVFGGGSGAGPSFDDAAVLAVAPASAAAPALDPTDHRLVQAKVGDVPFPNYTYRWPRWRTAGARDDRVGGRNAVTVVYRGPRGDVGYTIVDGAPLDVPAGARHVTVDGVRLAVVRRGATTFVTWRRGGHTCVLAGRGAGVEQQLLRFAVWT